MLREEGIEVLDRFTDKDMDMDYSETEVADRIVKRHLGLVRESDVIVVVLNGPSYGAAMEVCVGKQLGKRIILFCEHEVPTPCLSILKSHNQDQKWINKTLNGRGVDHAFKLKRYHSKK